jgi:hypothetical protein
MKKPFYNFKTFEDLEFLTKSNDNKIIMNQLLIELSKYLFQYVANIKNEVL